MTTETIGTLDYNEITFPKLGIDLHLDSTAFSIGGLDIQWYGILITLGLVLAMVYAFTQVKKYGLNPDRVMDCIIGGIIGGVVGARAYYVLLNWNNYAGDWKSILNIREGGLAIYGGIIGSFLAGLLVAKIRKVKFLPLLDIVGIGFLLGQGIGRWGNFFNQEAFGCNTNSIFGMSGGRIQEWITDQYPSTTYFANFGTALDASQPVHPCFLYESVWCLLGFVLLALFAKKIRRYDGQIFLIYICWYGAERAVVEGLRTDSLVIGNVRVSQILAICCVVVSVILQIAIGTRSSAWAWTIICTRTRRNPSGCWRNMRLARPAQTPQRTANPTRRKAQTILQILPQRLTHRTHLRTMMILQQKIVRMRTKRSNAIWQS